MSSHGSVRGAVSAGEAASQADTHDDGPKAAAGSHESVLHRGRSLGRYVVLDELGAGGMGTVYMAYDPELERKVAIKILSQGYEESQASTNTEATPAARLMREAQALAKLSHPNVLPIFDIGMIEGRVFMAIAYVEGSTLDDWWMAERRSWREVLRCFVQAGRGLAAAHQAGLVHRDFKPQNCLVGFDGQVRVLDFGLARRGQEPDAPETPDPRDAGSDPNPSRDLAATTQDVTSRSALREDLTVAGTVLGTPAYMAPEQHAGAVADAAADQYAFCVALYYGLHGQLPFARGPQMISDKLALRLQPLSARRYVPRWLYNVVLRGLDPNTSKRWPSMAALLVALQRDPRATWLRYGVMAAGLSVAVGAGWAYGEAQEHRAALCEGASDKLQSIWDEGVRPRMQQAFLATGTSLAPDTWTRTAKLLDAYAHTWSQSYRDACEATHVREQQPAAVLDLRMGCLDRTLREFKAVTKLLAVADEEIVANAVTSLQALPKLGLCSDVEALRAGADTPPEAKRVAIDAVRERMADVRALDRAGKHEQAHTLAQQLLTQSRELAYAPLIAEALFALGSVQEPLGKYEEAIASVTEATWLAEGRKLDALAARTQVLLAHIHGNRLRQLERGLTWGRHARALIDRLPEGERERHRAGLWDSLGSIHMVHADLDPARDYYERALEVRTRLDGADSLEIVGLYNNLANVYAMLDRTDEAIVFYQRTLDGLERHLGPQHSRAGATFVNLGLTHALVGRLHEAKHAFGRAIEVLEPSLGADHPYIGYATQGVADAEARLGNTEQALVAYGRALEIQERAHGNDHPSVFGVLVGYAEALADAGRGEETEKVLARATSSIHSGSHAAVQGLQLALARTHWLASRDEHRAVIDVVAKAIATVDTVEDARRDQFHQRLLLRLGRSLRAMERLEDAKAALERALALEGKPWVEGDIHFERAQVVADGLGSTVGEAEVSAMVRTATQHAEQALAAYERGGDGLDDEVAAVRAFIERMSSGSPHG